MGRANKLPDVLTAGLDVVFVGTAAGARSAAEGVYYAHPGNRFWKTLRATGLLPSMFKASEFRQAVGHGIGLTDMCKLRAGSDAQIGNDAFDRARFERAIRAAAPKLVAFTSKKAASVWFRRPTAKIAYGPQPPSDDGFPPVFVLPSPSGLASSSWDERPWHALAAQIRRPPRRPRTAHSPG